MNRWFRSRVLAIGGSLGVAALAVFVCLLWLAHDAAAAPAKQIDGVQISGPTTGIIDTATTFTATVSPPDATLPIIYHWQATDQTDVEVPWSDRTHAIPFTWTAPGTKVITVTATNPQGTVTDTYTTTISVPPSGVQISGPTTGIVNAAYSFTATVSPPGATLPITYHWQATGQTDVVVSRNARTDAIPFTWTTPGTKAITVTATNAGGTAADTTTIVVSIPPSEVEITGPTAGIVNAPYTFTATVIPSSATLPITYHWQATGQTDVVVSRNARTDAIPFTWTAPGTKTITVTASNAGGTAIYAHTITISIPPSGVEINGPSVGIINGSYAFTSAVSPPDATLPITYHWQATGLSPQTHVVGDITDMVSFAWSTLGPQTITVTVSNAGGTVSSTHYIGIGSADFPFYDGFESGVLSAGWTTSTTGNGRIRVSNAYPHSGTYSVLLDNGVGTENPQAAAVILNIDLAGQVGVALDFWWREFADEDHVEDGVFISDDDGASWHQALSFNGEYGSTYQHAVIYLDDVAAAHGLTFNGHFQIKFQFYDDYPIPSDGYAIDDVWVRTVPLEDVEISGPTMGNIDTSYTFTAAISPPTATLPINYTWSPSPATGQGSAVATYTWPDSGTKTINVAAVNVSGSASDVHTIIISVPPSGVGISGPSTGIINVPYTFNATVSPTNATLPITYHWQATGHTDVMVSRNSRTHALPFTWSTLGPQTITLTVTNAGGTVSSVHPITITAAGFPFYDGFESGALGAGWTTSTTLNGRVQVSDTYPHDGTYSVLLDSRIRSDDPSAAAVILNVDLAGQPNVLLDFWWREFMDEEDPEDGVFISDDDGTSWHRALSFNGDHGSTYQHAFIYLDDAAAAHGLAFNDHFQIKFQFYDGWPIDTDGYAIDDVRVRTVPVADADISGPTRGVIQVDTPFVAHASPITAGLPITYVWQATEQSPLIHTDRGVSDMVSFNWGTTGAKTITVTASNAEGSAIHTHVITLDVSPVTDLTLSGPGLSIAHTPTPFTATVGPITATQPIAYIWRATNQPSPVVHEGGGLTDVISFTWRITGNKTVTVTAVNAGGAVTESRTLTIIDPVPPEGVVITGPTEGIVQFGHTFTATVSPISTTAPITYVWSATANPSQMHTNDLNDTVVFAWDTPGIKTITVTAANPARVVSRTHVITARISPLTEVAIGGPTACSINTLCTFTATTAPPTATIPIDYVWSPTPATGQGSTLVSYSWPVTGPQTITVAATNAGSTVSGTYAVDIRMPVEDVTIEGPTSGKVNNTYTFTATASPPSAEPIVYIWSPTPAAGQSTAAVEYAWGITGTHTISVTATNGASAASGTYAITLGPHVVFLPVVVRSWPPILELYPIANEDGDGIYDVCWGPASPTSYVLEEATNSAFTGATQTYTTTTCSAITGKRLTRYYYRVAAYGNGWRGPWSNVQWVDVRWETEPDNNTPGGADGALISGVSYRGYPQRSGPEATKEDYFWFEPSARGQISVSLTDFVGDPGWLLLYYAEVTTFDASCFVGPGSSCCSEGPDGYNCSLTYHGNRPPDKYYIRVYTENYDPVTPYTLRVTYP